MTEEENIRLNTLSIDHIRRVDMDTGDDSGLTLCVLTRALLFYIAEKRVRTDTDILPEVLKILEVGVNDLERHMRGQMKQ